MYDHRRQRYCTIHGIRTDLAETQLRPSACDVNIDQISQGGTGPHGRFRVLLLMCTTWLRSGLLPALSEGHRGLAGTTGVVVDTDTGEPLAGAYVIGRWRGYVSSHSVCFHAEGTRTDTQGRFVLPAWRNTGPYNNTSHQQY